MIYEVAAALVGTVLLVAFFTFPETAYVRDPGLIDPDEALPAALPTEKPTVATADPTTGEVTATEAPTTNDVERNARDIPKKESYLSSLKIFHRTLTNESFLKLFLRPLGLICLPPVLWAALIQSVTIGFLVAVTSNVDPAFSQTYGLESWQIGLCFIAALIGSLLGIPAGGQLGDWVADYFTKRNGGVRDPEMRLPAMIPCLITTPLALILYGVGIQHNLHWMCPTIGLGLREYPIFLTGAAS